MKRLKILKFWSPLSSKHQKQYFMLQILTDKFKNYTNLLTNMQINTLTTQYLINLIMNTNINQNLLINDLSNRI